jgi:hypothetical protein
MCPLLPAQAHAGRDTLARIDPTWPKFRPSLPRGLLPLLMTPDPFVDRRFPQQALRAAMTCPPVYTRKDQQCLQIYII